MKEAGLPEYSPGGFIDTWGLARYVLPSPKNNPNNVPEDEMPKNHKLGTLLDFFGIDVEGELHNAKNDVEGTAKLLYKLLEHGAEGKALNGEKLSVADASNGFNYPKYKALAKTYKNQITEWVAKNADELLANGIGTNVDDFVRYLEYPYNATGANSTGAGSMLDDEDPSTSEASVVSAPTVNLPPTEKQLASLQRRLDTPGVFPTEESRKIVLDALPTMNRENIGSYIQLADALEVMSRMREGKSIDGLRIPHWFVDYVIGYKPTNVEKPEGDIDEMSESAPKDRTTIEKIRKDSKIKLKDFKFKKTPTKEQEDIIIAIAGGYDVRVQALAGTGKTSTIELAVAIINATDPKRKQSYLVFNANIAEEGASRLPDNVEVRTSDSISYNANANAALRLKHQDQSASPKFQPVSLYDNSIGLVGWLETVFPADKDGKKPDNVFTKALDKYKEVKIPAMSPDGTITQKSIPREVIAKAAGDMVREWSISGDDEMGEKHNISGLPYTQELLDLAKFFWSDIQAPLDPSKQQIKVEFEHMFKNWALTKPNWRHVDGYGKSIHGFKKGAPDAVYLDEAQDINEVFYKMLREQNELHNNGLQLVAVGDSNQSLYEFRGAMDALNKFEMDVTLPLSQSFRSGAAITDAANLFLDLRYGAGKGPRLVGNPNIKSKLVEPGKMDDYDAILVNTNLGALESIIQAGTDRPEAVIGVTPNFKNDFVLLVKTVRWLMTPIAKRNPQYKPKRMLPDLESFNTWKQVEEEYELHGSPMIGKYMGILSKAKEASPGESTDAWAALRFLEELIDKLRVKNEGFVVPQTIGTQGKLGNAIRYKIAGKKLILENDSFLKSWQLKPYQGTTNNKAILKHNGFVAPKPEPGQKPIYHYEAALTGDGRAQLEKLVTDLSGDNIDVEVTTVHRGKGLEYPKVLIWKDFPNPEDDAETLAIKVKDQILPEDPKERKKMLKEISNAEKRANADDSGKPLWEQASELNKYYTAFTRAMNELDAGGLKWIFTYRSTSAKSAPKVVTKAEATRREAVAKDIAAKKSLAEGEFGQVAKGVTYEVSGGNLIIAGKTDPYKKLLEGMGFVYRQDGKVWFLRIGKSDDAAQALGKRMKVIENLRKRINLS
jgi:hypothetical protein